MSIRTILVDDEPLAIAELQAMLREYPRIEVVATANTASDALEAIRRHQPDLLFLDINLSGSSGFDLLEELSSTPEVIFVTAYDHFAIKAFEVSALDYLLKPINARRLAEAIEKAVSMIPAPSPEKPLSPDKRIFIKDQDSCFFIPLADIFLIESVGNYARLFFQDNKPLIHKSLNYLEAKLPAEFFFRANRQSIFNINFIRQIYPMFNNTLRVELLGGQTIDLSQRQSAQFRERMAL